ncbi:hypothetical protein TNCV_3442301 [Trichonephila clavipes]|nr:hypothetical protein TNCV_3442301 [Trichonephila clavipes]
MCNYILPEKCRINIKFTVKLKKSATKTFRILTEAYGGETLFCAHVFEGHKRFLGGRDSVGDSERAPKNEANLQVYVETPLHPEKLTVWCALWAGGILLQKR